MSQWTSPGRIVTGLVSVALLVALGASMTGAQRAQSLGLTRHGQLITVQDAGAADAVAAVAVSPGTAGQVLTVSNAGLPHWAAASGGSTASNGTYASRPSTCAEGVTYRVSSGARTGSVYRCLTTDTWVLDRVAAPTGVAAPLVHIDAERVDTSASGAWVVSLPCEVGGIAVPISQSGAITVLASAAGGLPGITFASGHPGMRVPWMGAAGASSRALAVVVSRVTVGGGAFDHVAGWGTGSNGQLFAITTRTNSASVVGAHWWASNLSSAVAPVSGSTPSLYLLQYDGSTATLFQDGTSIASGAVSLNTGSANGLTIGVNPSSLTEAELFTLHALLAWSQTLDSTARSSLQTWAQGRWGAP